MKVKKLILAIVESPFQVLMALEYLEKSQSLPGLLWVRNIDSRNQRFTRRISKEHKGVTSYNVFKNRLFINKYTGNKHISV